MTTSSYTVKSQDSLLEFEVQNNPGLDSLWCLSHEIYIIGSMKLMSHFDLNQLCVDVYDYIYDCVQPDQH